MTIYTGTNATAAMKSVLTKTVGVMDIASHQKCKVLTVFRKNYCALDSSGGISVAANIADVNLNFSQSEASKRPRLITDSQTGREAAVFNANATNFMTLDPNLAINLNGAFSYLVVFKLSVEKVYQRILGSKETTTDKSAIEYVQTGRLRLSHLSSFTNTDLIPKSDKWYAAIASYDGNGNTTFETIGYSAQVNTSEGSKVGMDLILGSTAPGLGFTGSVDMAGYFDTNIHGNPALLADVKLMLKDFYGESLIS